MKVLKYYGMNRGLIATSLLLILLLYISYDNGSLFKISMYVWLLKFFIPLFIFSILSDLNNWIKVIDNRYLVVSGYNPFFKQKSSVFDIKYIYRAKADPLRLNGNLILIYFVNQQNRLSVIKIRESAYRQKTLKSFFEQMLKLKPSIELDEELKFALLKNKDDLWAMSPVKGVPEVEKLLIEKGEEF